MSLRWRMLSGVFGRVGIMGSCRLTGIHGIETRLSSLEWTGSAGRSHVHVAANSG